MFKNIMINGIVTDPETLKWLEEKFGKDDNEKVENTNNNKDTSATKSLQDIMLEVTLEKISKSNKKTLDSKIIKAVASAEFEKYDKGGYSFTVKSQPSKKVITKQKKMSKKMIYAKTAANIIPGGATFIKNPFDKGSKNKIEIYTKGIKIMQILLNASDEKMINEIIPQIVAHEWRHSRQFIYLNDKGGANLMFKVIKDEAKTAYGTGILETDAVSYQHGTVQDFDKIFADYIQ